MRKVRSGVTLAVVTDVVKYPHTGSKFSWEADEFPAYRHTLAPGVRQLKSYHYLRWYSSQCKMQWHHFSDLIRLRSQLCFHTQAEFEFKIASNLILTGLFLRPNGQRFPNSIVNWVTVHPTPFPLFFLTSRSELYHFCNIPAPCSPITRLWYLLLSHTGN